MDRDNYKLAFMDSDLRNRFIEAWESAFNRKLDANIYDWIFDDVNRIYVALYENQIAAGYCLYPVTGIVNGQKTDLLLCNNVFVSPDHQAKNLFVRLGRFALEDAGNKGFSLAYGIPNSNAIPGHKRVGWKFMPTIHFLEKTFIPAANIRNFEFLPQKLNEQEKHDIAKCSEQAALNRGFSIIKSEKFINWRYQKPHTLYSFKLIYEAEKLSAYAVYKYYAPTKTLHIVDIDGTDNLQILNIIQYQPEIEHEYNKITIWNTTAHAQQFLDSGYSINTDQNNLIVIYPGKTEKVEFNAPINVVLADNDVY